MCPQTREYPKPLFDLRRTVGPKGRASYDNRQKLQVLEFSRLICVDGKPVGKRGAATVFGVEPKLLRNWTAQEAELKRSFAGDDLEGGGGGGGPRSLHPGRTASKAKEVDQDRADLSFEGEVVPGDNNEVGGTS